MVRDPLRGIRHKLDRADEQYDTMAAAVLGFVVERPIEFKTGIHQERRQITLFADVKKTCPEIWGVLIGEFVHNLRSALDHLVWELVIHATGDPPTSKKTQFPIFQTPEGYESRSEPYIRGVSSAAEAMIRATQPFNALEPAKNPLWMLHELSNFDKHRTLHVTAMAFQVAELEVSGLPIAAQTQIMNRKPLHGFSGLVSFSFTEDTWPSDISGDHIRWDGTVKPDVVFDHGNPAEGMSVLSVMFSIKTEVRSDIRRIATAILQADDSHSTSEAGIPDDDLA